MKITVTEEDIKSGMRFSCRACPIARAASRALGLNDPLNDKQDVEVGNRTINLFDEHYQFIKLWPLPKEAVDFINAFDCGRTVEPFEFEVL